MPEMIPESILVRRMLCPRVGLDVVVWTLCMGHSPGRDAWRRTSSLSGRELSAALQNAPAQTLIALLWYDGVVVSCPWLEGAQILKTHHPQSEVAGPARPCLPQRRRVAVGPLPELLMVRPLERTLSRTPCPVMAPKQKKLHVMQSLTEMWMLVGGGSVAV